MISKVIKKYRNQQSITQEGFANRLCEGIPGVDLTKQAISNWERDAQTPDYMFMISVLMSYRDWRHDFALECLQVMRPEVWADRIKE